jgi:hypothetical protein
MAVAKKAAVKKTAPKKVKKQAVPQETACIAEVMPKAPARVRAAKPKTTEASANANEPVVYVVIDHPVNNEVLVPGHYAIRIGASWGGIVEFQINDADWIPCRHNAGYWWFDWHNIPAGKHKLAARLVDNNGTVLKKSAIRRVEVK